MSLDASQATRADRSEGGVASAALSRRLLLCAVAFGLTGAGLLMLYLNRFEEVVSGGSRVQLLTVIKPVERGALLTEDMLSIIEVPLAYVEQRAVKAADRGKVVGIRTDNALEAQDTLMWSDLAISSDDRDLSSLVQPGKRAITVRASEAGSDPAGNGLLRPGDYVDVIVTLRSELGEGAPSAIVLLQRVLVLAVGNKTQPQGFGDKSGDNSRASAEERELTLSLKVEEAQLLSLARERGTLSVALRGPADSKVTEGIADMPLSSLYDKTARETVQRRRNHAQGPTPIRLAQGEP
jgi:pilus assembly protein CpaB